MMRIAVTALLIACVHVGAWFLPADCVPYLLCGVVAWLVVPDGVVVDGEEPVETLGRLASKSVSLRRRNSVLCARVVDARTRAYADAIRQVSEENAALEDANTRFRLSLCLLYWRIQLRQRCKMDAARGLMIKSASF